MGLTRASNDLPAGDDAAYYSAYPEYRNRLDSAKTSMLRLLNRVSSAAVTPQAPSSTPGGRLSTIKAPELSTEPGSQPSGEELGEGFGEFVEMLDTLLEAVDGALDEARGVKKAGEGAPTVAPTAKIFREFKMITGAVPRVQNSFPVPPDNSNKPFYPILTSKPHAKVPLEESVTRLPGKGAQDEGADPDIVAHLSATFTRLPPTRGRAAVLASAAAAGLQGWTSPYAPEIEAWKKSPPAKLFERVTPVKWVTPLPEPTWVDTVEALEAMMEELDGEDAVAIDLEHHNIRSFQGFTCLMQVSTRTHDWLVDTLALRGDLEVLNKITTDPNVLKVLHGADMDVQWLQRDFGVYLVGLFDTGQASRTLENSGHSLAAQLLQYVKLSVDKKFQRADWRLRPLTPEMRLYAQQDTHYLLYVADVMRNQLLDMSREKMMEALERSCDVAMSTYEKDLLLPDSHLRLLQKYNSSLNAQQMRVLKAIYAWRDEVARTEDESPRYVLIPHMMLKIAEMMPADHAKLMACCSPVPPLVRANAQDILQAVKKAVNSPVTPPTSAPASPVRSGPGGSASTPRSPAAAGSELDVAEAARRAAASPVMTTDSLYTTAGWTETNPSRIGTTAKPASDLLGETRAGPRAGMAAVAAVHDALPSLTGLGAHPDSFPAPEAVEASGTGGADAGGEAEAMEVSKPAVSKGLLPEVAGEGGIPSTVAEIYALSNANRKRNKEKKRLKEEPARAGSVGGGSSKGGDGSSVGSSAVSEDRASVERSTKRQRTEDDTESFIRNIGWLGQEEEMPSTMPGFHESGASEGGNRDRAERGSNNGSSGGSRRKLSKSPSTGGRNRSGGKGGSGFDYNSSNSFAGVVRAQSGRNQEGPAAMTVPSVGSGRGGGHYGDRGASRPNRGGRGGGGRSGSYGAGRRR